MPLMRTPQRASAAEEGPRITELPSAACSRYVIEGDPENLSGRGQMGHRDKRHNPGHEWSAPDKPSRYVPQFLHHKTLGSESPMATLDHFEPLGISDRDSFRG